MSNEPSERLIDQRVRKRILETLFNMAEGESAVRKMGVSEYFESFYDWTPHRDRGVPHANSAMNADEFAALKTVSSMMDDACDSTPSTMSEEDFIASGWPARLQSIAKVAAALMMSRGRFSEDAEEDSPKP